jgi:hypothetical protein
MGNSIAIHKAYVDTLWKVGERKREKPWVAAHIGNY